MARLPFKVTTPAAPPPNQAPQKVAPMPGEAGNMSRQTGQPMPDDKSMQEHRDGQIPWPPAKPLESPGKPFRVKG